MSVFYLPVLSRFLLLSTIYMVVMLSSSSIRRLLPRSPIYLLVWQSDLFRLHSFHTSSSTIFPSLNSQSTSFVTSILQFALIIAICPIFKSCLKLLNYGSGCFFMVLLYFYQAHPFESTFEETSLFLYLFPFLPF